MATAAVVHTHVPAAPWLEWLRHTDRSGWVNTLSKTQVRYIERVLDRRPKTVNVFSVDDVLVTLDLPHLLSVLYPD